MFGLGSVPAYATAMEDAANAQVTDTCAVIAGYGTLCGADTTPSQTQGCPAGAAIPNPIGGGLAGNSLQNSNAALQRTCDVSGLGGVNPGDLPGAAMAAAGALQTGATASLTPIQSHGTTGTFTYVSAMQASSCQYLLATPSCL